MAEIAGLATGTIALASLFSTVIELFDRFELGRNYQNDYQLACTKIRLLETRVIGWGGCLNVLAPGCENEALRRHWPEVQESVTGSLLGINAIFGNASTLANKYDISRTGSRRLSTTHLNAKIANDLNINRRHGSLKYTSWFVLRRRTLWAIHDKDKLDSLIQDLEFLVTNLEKVIERLQMANRESNPFNLPGQVLRQQGDKAGQQPPHRQSSSGTIDLNKTSVPDQQTKNKTKYGLIKSFDHSTVSMGNVGTEQASDTLRREDQEFAGAEARNSSAVHAGNMNRESHLAFHNKNLHTSNTTSARET